MNETVILVVNYEKICRLCLQSTGAMSDIFENTDGICLRELVFQVTTLEAIKDDGLPTTICHRCRHIMELSCDLKTMAIKNNSLLRDADNSTIGIEHGECGAEEPIKLADSSPLQDIAKDSLLVDQIENIDNNNILQHQEYSKPKDYQEEIPQTGLKRTPPKHLTCQICLISFLSTKEVSDHASAHYVGSQMTPYLELQDSLRHHQVRHGARSHVCEACGAAFRRRCELRAHATRTHRARAAHCRLCDARFSNDLTYRAHLAKHHNAPRHRCQWPGCSKAYHSAAALTEHTRAHAGERIYKCHLCAAAAYTSQSQLNRHVRMHGRARMSKCDKCATTFEDYGAFYRHRVSEHGPWQPHRCPACNKGYQKETKLAQHMESCESIIRNATEKTSGTDSTPTTPTTVKDQILLVQEINTEDNLRAKLKGQSLLLQPRYIHGTDKDIETLANTSP